MKWQTASIGLMALTLTLTGATLIMDLLTPRLKASGLFSQNANNINLQLGYYDLLSKSSELYNPHFDISPNAILMKLFNPDDNRMQITLRMTLEKVTPQGMLYSYKFISMPGKDNDLLIANTLGYLQRQSIMLNSVSYPGGNVTITPSGLIISHISGSDAPIKKRRI